MKNFIALVLLSGVVTGSAAIVTFDLSPAGTDNAVGLSPLNETPPVLNSTGSGNEIGSGITFNTDTFTLNLSLGYGSAFGFSNLTGAATDAHIHGPAPTNTPAAIITNLAGIHLLATNPAAGGSIVGSVTLTPDQATALLAGLYYINIHTATNPGGEIRGQLVPADILPTLVCPASTNAECAGTNDTFITLNAQVADTEGDALTVVWSVDGVAIQTNTVAAGASTNLTSVNFSAVYDVGIHAVTISVSDGVDVPVTCTATVTIVDTIPPTILSASLTPAVLWPPNHKLNTVQVSVIATDLCNGTATCRIKSIQSSQGALVKGSGKTSPDAQITGALTAKVRAERSGKEKSGRTYTIVVECSDPSGNAATTNLVVFVPHDQGNHGNSTNAPGQTGTLPPQSNGNGNGNGHGHGNH